MTTRTAGITAHWSIHRSGFRTAPAAGLTLQVRNGRRGGTGPVDWAVYSAAGRVAAGEVWQGTRYSALVRQAMFDAEQAAARLLQCDDCGRVDGSHDPEVEH